MKWGPRITMEGHNVNGLFCWTDVLKLDLEASMKWVRSQALRLTCSLDIRIGAIWVQGWKLVRHDGKWWNFKETQITAVADWRCHEFPNMASAGDLTRNGGLRAHLSKLQKCILNCALPLGEQRVICPDIVYRRQCHSHSDQLSVRESPWCCTIHSRSA